MNWNLIELVVVFFFNVKVCFVFKRVRRRLVKLYYRLQDRSVGEERELNIVVMNFFWTFWSLLICLCFFKVCLLYVYYEQRNMEKYMYKYRKDIMFIVFILDYDYVFILFKMY